MFDSVKTILAMAGDYMAIILHIFSSDVLTLAGIAAFVYVNYLIIRASSKRPKNPSNNTAFPLQKGLEISIFVFLLLAAIPWVIAFCLYFSVGYVLLVVVSYTGLNISNPNLQAIPHLLKWACIFNLVTYYLYPLTFLLYIVKIMRAPFKPNHYAFWLLAPVITALLWLTLSAFIFDTDDFMKNPHSAKVLLWLEQAISPQATPTSPAINVPQTNAILPQGSYSQTCTDCRFEHYTTLYCTCLNTSGSTVHTELNLETVNFNGPASQNANSPTLQNCNGRLRYIDHC